MSRILVHVTVGPSDPTKAALAFLIARTVVTEGHQLALFVAGDGVHLLTAEVAAKTEGLGTGKLMEHLDALNAADGAEIYFSGMSAKARNITADQIVLKGAQPAMPPKLVQLTADCDRVLCY
ncbi:Predicted peroxiredoxin [Devosia lucknowensis]|uniref:Predicted peroxiredoxin n=1 Tax=Devosia lucknowensis TaxID=1096929 RepID=A0A1Y6EQL8_9HYPH|nr:DsrE family protein [Devosia lucknowensis]SMQ64995.1 Predicted peroxiredoxin [Devosia lucknowensis]